NPEDSIAWNGLGNVYQAIGYYDDAITSYRKSIQFTSTFAQPWNGLGDVYSILGRMEDAIAAYERSINISRSYAEPWNGLAKIFLKQERHRDAIKAFQRILSINERDCKAWNELGMAQLKIGDLASAEKSFRNAIRVDRTFGKSYKNLGVLFEKLDRHDEAIVLLTKSLEFLNNEEERAELWNELGELYRRINKYDLAVQAYKNADLKNRGNQPHEIGPIAAEMVSKPDSDVAKAHPQPLEQKMAEEITPGFERRSNVVEPPAWLKVRENSAPEAGETETINGVAMQPDTQTNMNEYEPPMEKSGSESKVDAPAWNEIGNEHFRKGNYGEAIISYNKAVQKDPAFGMPYANMGLISLMQGRFSEAILLYNKSVQLLETNPEKAVVYNGLGNSYRAIGDYTKAAVCFRKAAELDPDKSGVQDRMGACQIGESSTSAAFWKELGLAFLENSSFNEALTSLNKAAEIDPNDGWIHLNIGKALSFSGKHAEAIAPYARSLDLFKNNKEKAVAMNLMGNAYRKLNNYDKAIECFQRAVVLNDEGVNLVTRARFSLLSNCLAE
ncbi:MAG: tetratricopeptide repeat protein, partial [Chloroflexi bacterium CFX2]|nr:tetratricopeptide repeat protein [Chloroflexi bacterium CFX2]